MAFHFCSFASGSTGNCYMAKTETTVLLIDTGIAGRKIISELSGMGICEEDVNGILVTHEHIDHVKSLKMLARKAINASVYASSGTLRAVADKIEGDRSQTVRAGEAFLIGDITVIPFRISHDAAEPFGYSLLHGGRQLTVVTDTGYISDEIYSHIAKADLLVLEANHEVNILKMGAYPYSLKRRILGDEGHLSNEAAGDCLCRMLNERKKRGDDEEGADGKNADGYIPQKVPKVMLAHLSKDNNTPGQAYLTIRNILFESDFYINKDLELDIAARDESSVCVEI